ncbi:hypothetical protein M758_4G015000 [Ceratodon purpureus]|nr:hypothetical protein M758_4G015000 [Ceratodon purpureus]
MTTKSCMTVTRIGSSTLSVILTRLLHCSVAAMVQRYRVTLSYFKEGRCQVHQVFIIWSSASLLFRDIDTAPQGTSDELRQVRDLIKS